MTTPVHTSTLTHYLTKDPLKVAALLEKIAYIAKVCAIVTAVAIVAIAAAVLAIAYSAITLSTTHTVIVLGAVLLTLPLSTLPVIFQNQSKKYYELAAIERGVGKEFLEIQDWTPEQIQKFAEKEQIALGPIKDKQILPLIARYIFLKTTVSRIAHEARESLEDASDDEELRRIVRRTGYEMLALSAVPKALEAAVVIELIKNPYQEIALKDIGQITKDESVPKPNDAYFIFSDKERQPLDLNTLARHLDPNRLHPVLFHQTESQSW